MRAMIFAEDLGGSSNDRQPAMIFTVCLAESAMILQSLQSARCTSSSRRSSALTSSSR